MKIENITTGDKVIGGAFSVIAIIYSLAILHSDTTLSYPAIVKICVIIKYACLFLLLFASFSFMPKIRISGIFLLLSLAIYFCFNFCYRYKDGLDFTSINIFISLVFFSGMSAKSRLFSFYLFRKFLVVSCLLGIIIYVCHIFSINIPHKIVPYYDKIHATYFDYGLAYVVSDTFSVRLCGLFNEPGYLGTINALCLIVDGLNLRRLSNVFLLLAGFLTLSLSFFLLLIIGALIILIKNKILLVITFISILLSFAILIYYADSIPLLDLFINKHFSVVDGVVTGNNRSTQIIEDSFSQLFNSDKLLFGYGVGYSKYLDPISSSSYKLYFLDYGLIGTMLIFIPLLFSVKMQGVINSRYYWTFIICYLLNIYQRPWIIACNYLLILFGGINHIKYKVIHKEI